MKIRVAIAFDNFGPYHIARLAAAARHVEVLAVETGARSAQYAWEAPQLPACLGHTVLIDGADTPDKATFLSAIDAKLGAFRPDAVAVPGWSSAAALAITRWAARRSIPVIAMSESNSWDFSRNPVAEFVKRRLAEYFSAGLCTSDDQAAYLEALGLPAQAIFRGYNAVDNDYFAREAARARDAAMPAGDRGSLPEEARGRYFLASCRFVAKKNLPQLLEAYALFRRDRGDDAADWPLVVLGDGELRRSLEAQRSALGLSAHVHMPGFRQYDALPSYYGTAGCFVHASTTEQWGLVVNEAMASGLPVIVSNRSGCASVLVEDGVNGYRVASADAEALARPMRMIAAQKDDTAMRQASRAAIAAWGPGRFGQGLADAAHYAQNCPRRVPSLFARAALSLAFARLPLR